MDARTLPEPAHLARNPTRGVESTDVGAAWCATKVPIVLERRFSRQKPKDRWDGKKKQKRENPAGLKKKKIAARRLGARDINRRTVKRVPL